MSPFIKPLSSRLALTIGTKYPGTVLKLATSPTPITQAMLIGL